MTLTTTSGSAPPCLLAALLVTLVLLSSPEARAESRKDCSVPVRRALLRDYLEPHREPAAIAPYGAAVLGLLALGGGVGVGVGGVEEDPSGRSRWVIAGSYGAASAVSFGSFALHADYRNSAIAAALGLLIFGTGAGVYASSEVSDTVRFSSAAMMGTGLVYGGLAAADAALLRPVSSATLVEHLARLERRGAHVTSEELAAMERDFARMVRPIPLWTLSLTLGVGGLVATSPAFFDGASKDDKTTSLMLGVALLIPAFTSSMGLAASSRNSYGAYERALHNVQLAPLGPAGSAGATVTGRF